MSATILIVDDDPVQRRLLESAVNKSRYRSISVEDGEKAVELLGSAQAASVDLVILDLVMPGLDGMGVLERLSKMGVEKPVVVQTSQAGIETVVSAMRAGACDFCVKPVSPERLKISIQNALKLGAMEVAVRRAQKSVGGVFTFEDMIADSTAMQKVTRLGERAADSNIPVLIEGESGVGKEVFAKAIQGSSARQGKPFVTVNCGALPENLVESILFGHEKGSFTGANQSHTGKFKEADGGTLFLDEIGELSLDIQVKLLRALQEGEIDPVGAKRPVKTDFRLITATNRDMVDLVKQGLFREDLYYRINVFPVNVPPLRSRKTDIAALVSHFTARIALEEGRRNVSGIRTDALAMLEAYDWPGNIRQLENAIFRAVILCDGEQLTPDEFPQVMAAMGEMPAAAYDEQIAALENIVQQAGAIPVAEDSLTMLSESGDLRSMNEIEGYLIRFAIDHHQGRMTRIAKSLGIGRSTLYRKLKEHNILAREGDDEVSQDAA